MYSSRLCASLRVTIKCACSVESWQNILCIEACNLQQLTSCLFSKLDSVACCYHYYFLPFLILPRGSLSYEFPPGCTKMATDFTKRFCDIVSSSVAVILMQKNQRYGLQQGHGVQLKFEGRGVIGTYM